MISSPSIPPPSTVPCLSSSHVSQPLSASSAASSVTNNQSNQSKPHQSTHTVTVVSKSAFSPLSLSCGMHPSGPVTALPGLAPNAHAAYSLPPANFHQAHHGFAPATTHNLPYHVGTASHYTYDARASVLGAPSSLPYMTLHSTASAHSHNQQITNNHAQSSPPYVSYTEAHPMYPLYSTGVSAHSSLPPPAASQLVHAHSTSAAHSSVAPAILSQHNNQQQMFVGLSYASLPPSGMPSHLNPALLASAPSLPHVGRSISAGSVTYNVNAPPNQIRSNATTPSLSVPPSHSLSTPTSVDLVSFPGSPSLASRGRSLSNSQPERLTNTTTPLQSPLNTSPSPLSQMQFQMPSNLQLSPPPPPMAYQHAVHYQQHEFHMQHTLPPHHPASLATNLSSPYSYHAPQMPPLAQYQAPYYPPPSSYSSSPPMYSPHDGRSPSSSPTLAKLVDPGSHNMHYHAVAKRATNTPIAQASMSADSHRRLGFSCHSCKVSRPEAQLYFCTNTQKIITTGRKNCRKKYCLACMKRSYSRSIPLNRVEVLSWLCPSCTNTCICASCQHRTVADLEQQQLIKSQQQTNSTMQLQQDAPSSDTSNHNTTNTNSVNSPDSSIRKRKLSVSESESDSSLVQVKAARALSDDSNNTPSVSDEQSAVKIESVAQLP